MTQALANGLPKSVNKSWLEELQISYGPVAEIGRFLLTADRAATLRGVHMSIQGSDLLRDVNRSNRASWYPLAPPLDPERVDLSGDRFFCLAGHDAGGECVAMISGRFYDWSATTMYDEVQAMRFFYDNPDRDPGPGETAIITSQAARSIRGRVAYLGSAWYRPDHRKRGLPGIFSRAARCYALGIWNTDTTIGIMTDKVVAMGLRQQIGHPHLDWGIQWNKSPLGDLNVAVVWINRQETIDDMVAFGRQLSLDDTAVAHQRRA